jgi:hypothetical protein
LNKPAAFALDMAYIKAAVKHFFFFLVALFLFASCRTTKKVTEAPLPVKLKGDSVIVVFDSLMRHQFDFNWLTAKAEVEYTDKNNETTSFDINLRMRKDSAIWISITPLLGIEVARVLVTQDSIRILDRLNKTYMLRDFGFLEDLLKTKINFDIMQAVIIGNYFPYLKNEKLKSVYEDSTFLILSTLSKHKVKRVLEDKDPNKPIIQDFWIDSNYKINRSKITDDKLDRTLEANYSHYFEVNNKLFPQHIMVNVTAASPLKINIQFSKVNSDEMSSMPFSIPEKYEKK